MAHKILELTETCTGCFACSNACPNDAITMPTNKEGFYFPSIDSSRCIDCGLCDKVCPQLKKQTYYSFQKAFYGWSTNDEVRKQSSSGGLFFGMAKMVLDEGGVVYGSSFNYEGPLRLECHSTKEVELTQLMRSKYVQSYMGYAFRQIRNDLRIGQKVLFCGTPCQTAGLKSYLKKDFENLYLVDFICHGVPSMDLLQKHLDYLGIKHVVDINFRPKNRSWVDDFEIRYRKSATGEGNRLRRIPWEYDEYFCLFEAGKTLRRSCRNCLYCNGMRASDTTLADFWGINKYKPEQWDAKGQSLFFANTHKGEVLIKKLLDSQEYVINELPAEYAHYVFGRDRKAADSPYQSRVRDEFLHDVYAIGYLKALKKNGLKTNRLSVL